MRGSTGARALQVCDKTLPKFREHDVHSTSPQPTYAHPARLILILGIAPAVGLGICRFAYSLVLPDMRDSLTWSYSTAGFMNTINAAGYLIGALGASAFVRRFGLFRSVWIGAVACVVSLVISAISANFVIFSGARLLSGIAAAIAFVGGGTLATNIALSQRERAAFYQSLFYVGPAVGLLISGFVAPFILQAHGRGAWWIVWAWLAAISAVLTTVLGLSKIREPAMTMQAKPIKIAITPVLPFLTGYFLFGAGYIAYMTFMIAFVRDAGGGALAQSAFWTCIGIGAIAQPWVWGGLMARGRSGWVTALMIGITAIGALIPLAGTSPTVLAISALVFGNAFFAVVSSTTVFARFNYPPEAWPRAIAMMTIAFGIGQIIGPTVTGAITDALGSLSYALNISAGVLVLGVVASLFQKPLKPAA
jgi:predicted MFS family arabinose efflux permease